MGNVERTFAGTALYISALHKELIAFQARMEQRFDRVLGKHGRFDRIDGQFDRIEPELRGVRADIPEIIRRALREAQRRSGYVCLRTKHPRGHGDRLQRLRRP